MSIYPMSKEELLEYWQDLTADQQEESDDMPVIDWLPQKAIMAHLFLIYHQSRITSGQPRMIPGFCGYAMN